MRAVRVLLASAPHADTFGYSMPPPGLLRLGGELLRRGVPVELDDLAFRLANGEVAAGDGLARSCAERLVARGATVLGLSTMGATLPVAVEIARHVRAADPAVRIVLGGPGTGGVDAALLERFPWLDAVVRGEGEETLPELLARLAAAGSPRGVAGVTWRDGAGAAVREPDRPPLSDLGALAPYAWELLPPLAAYKAITGEKEGLTPVDSGRGCVYDCSFCSIGRFWGRRSRPLPAERLADEVAAIRGIPGARNAYLCHDLFGADREHALAFCDAMTRRGADVPWECRARVDHLDRGLLERMGRAGCYRVLLGVESASPAVRRRNQKGMADDVDVLAVVRDCAAAGVTPILSLILGLPGEGEAELAASLDLCADAALVAGVNLSLHLANPQPGCALGDEIALRSRRVEGIPPDMAWGAGESAPERELVAAHPDLFSTWHLLPLDEGTLRDLHSIATELPQVLARYPRTFALLRRRAGTDALGLYRRWRATGRSFEALAREAADARVDDVLEWEQALVRVAARGPREGGPAAPDATPVTCGELLVARHDLGAAPGPDADPGPDARRERHFAVVPVAGALGGARTLRVSRDVAALLGCLDGATPLERLEARRPGIGRALEQLAGAGLVTFQRPLIDRPPR